MSYFCGWILEHYTFEMEVNPMSKAFQRAIRHIQKVEVQDPGGNTVSVSVIPFRIAAAILGESSWIIEYQKMIRYFSLDGGAKIYVLYDDGIHF